MLLDAGPQGAGGDACQAVLCPPVIDDLATPNSSSGTRIGGSGRDRHRREWDSSSFLLANPEMDDVPWGSVKIKDIKGSAEMPSVQKVITIW